MPTLTQWLVAKGILATARVSAWCGNEESRKHVVEYDAQRFHRKAFRKIHEYAHMHDLSYREAAKLLGVPISKELMEAFQIYDPAFFRTPRKTSRPKRKRRGHVR